MKTKFVMTSHEMMGIVRKELIRQGKVPNVDHTASCRARADYWNDGFVIEFEFEEKK